MPSVCAYQQAAAQRPQSGDFAQSLENLDLHRLVRAMCVQDWAESTSGRALRTLEWLRAMRTVVARRVQSVHDARQVAFL